MYAVIGASGNTGSVVALELLAHGEKVRVLGRNANHLKHHVEKGAEAIVANVTDGEALAKAFEGVKAAYLMIPPNPGHANVPEYQKQASDALAAAVQKSGLKYVVVLSSLGADKPDRTGPVLGLRNLELKLNGISGLNAFHLRPGYFMENTLPQAGIIKSFGTLGGPLRGDLKVPMIATADIGAYAAGALLKLSFRGIQTRELLGPRDLSYQEAASIIGKAIGKANLGYMQMGAAQLKPALMQIGMSANMADLLLEMSDALNDGYMAAIEPRSAQNTTPTSFETFVAKVFVPLYSGKTASA